MKIHGLQKMTLLDYPGKVACTVFFGGCDLRCPFCHNSALWDEAAPAALDDRALLDFLRRRRGLLDGVAVTGGEPLLRDLAPLLAEIKALGYPVKLDTNGFHPGRLRALLEAGLVDYVAVDIKNSPVRYAETVGLPSLDLSPLRESAALLLGGGAPDYEFRTTAVDELHSAVDFRAIGEWIKGARRWFLQAFADRDSVPFSGLHPPSPALLAEYLDIVRPFVGYAALRGTDTTCEQ